MAISPLQIIWPCPSSFAATRITRILWATSSSLSGSGRHLVMTEGHRIICPRQQVHFVGHGPTGSKSWRQDTESHALGRQQDTGLCALGGKSQDHRSCSPQVMVARSHTLGSKCRKASSHVHRPSRQQVRAAGHRFSLKYLAASPQDHGSCRHK